MNALLRLFRRKRRRRALHPCHACWEMMEANGWGLCPACIEAEASNDPEDLYRRIRPRFTQILRDEKNG